MTDAGGEPRPPAPTIVRWAALVTPGTSVLDVAAGGGRHSRLFAARGCGVTAVDRDVRALRPFAAELVDVIEADIENAPWPLPGRQFDAVVVVDYLWRPLFADIAAAVAPGGLLLYETFQVGHERFGRPRNPDFLLRPGELRAAFEPTLDVLEVGEGEVGEPPHAVRQRLLARRSRR